MHRWSSGQGGVLDESCPLMSKWPFRMQNDGGAEEEVYSELPRVRDTTTMAFPTGVLMPVAPLG